MLEMCQTTAQAEEEEEEEETKPTERLPHHSCQSINTLSIQVSNLIQYNKNISKLNSLKALFTFIYHILSFHLPLIIDMMVN